MIQNTNTTATAGAAFNEQGAQFHDIVADLREFASNPGYSHNDYADIMRKAANSIELLRAQFWHVDTGRLAAGAANAFPPVPITPWQERLPVPQRAYTCDMNCSGDDRRHNSPTSCGDCMPVMIYGDAVAARDAEIAEWRASFGPQAHPGAQLAPLKDHEVRELVNTLRDLAVKYHAAGQLREQIAHVVVPALRRALPAKAAERTQAALDVLAERGRQVEAEGWTPEKDDQYVNEELRKAATAYLQTWTPYLIPSCWPWSSVWWKPSDDRRNLVKAGALILAEIERLDREALVKAHAPVLKGTE